jgi:aldose 1-epimerase
MRTGLGIVILGLALVQPADVHAQGRTVTTDWGRTADGTAVELYTLTNAGGASVTIATWGATVVSITVPDRAGRPGDVLLGFDTLAPYLQPHPFFGSVVGRYGNRIGNARFTLDGQTYTLAKNNGEHSLHGGRRGFDKHVWKARTVPSAGGQALELVHVSPDGDEGYPGTLTATVVYTWTNDNALRIDYTARTDKPTVVNLTNHAYFNLSAGAAPSILDHRLELAADRFTPVDEGLIPTGELRPVEGTPFDFRTPRRIGDGIDADDQQIRFGGGYDHNFVLNGQMGTLRRAAHVTDPASGRTMEVLTTEPGVQFYTGNFLDGTITGKGGRIYARRSGFCLETQHFPDSPNKPDFPSVVLRPGETYRTTTVYTFGVEGGTTN